MLFTPEPTDFLQNEARILERNEFVFLNLLRYHLGLKEHENH